METSSNTNTVANLQNVSNENIVLSKTNEFDPVCIVLCSYSSFLIRLKVLLALNMNLLLVTLFVIVYDTDFWWVQNASYL